MGRVVLASREICPRVYCAVVQLGKGGLSDRSDRGGNSPRFSAGKARQGIADESAAVQPEALFRDNGCRPIQGRPEMVSRETRSALG